MNFWNLDYWKTGEWQVVKERLSDLRRQGIKYCPSHDRLFLALSLGPMIGYRVVIVGQDPYPNPLYATGLAFSIPKESPTIPPTLSNIFDEYCSDLHYPRPKNGDLSQWCENGVFLWNAYPTCLAGKPGSHHWEEWTFLTRELVEKFAKQGVVFVFLGRAAQEFQRYVKETDPSRCLGTSHPSPLGVSSGKCPFAGSRIFSVVNQNLVELGKQPVNWRL